MPQGIDYPLNTYPQGADQLLGIDNPGDAENWSIQRYSIDSINKEIIDALNEQGIFPGELVFQTEGSTFAPVIVVDGTPDILWTFSDGTTSTSATPSIDFGSTGTRKQRLKVTPWSAVTRINVGYDAADGGAGDIEHIDQQNVSHIFNLHLVAPTLVDFCSNYNPITDIDFHDFVSLDTIEMYGSDLVNINMNNLPVLKRAAFENSDVVFLDFSSSPLMEDVRGSSTNITEIRWGTTGTYLWHMCVRNNGATLDSATWPDMTQFPVLRDTWIHDNGLTGHLELSSTVTSSIWAQNNELTSIDISNAFPTLGGHYVNAYNNLLTSFVFDNCPGLDTVDIHDNLFPQAEVDRILASFDSQGASNGTLDISGTGNAAPSAAGLTSIANLEGKGWTVTSNTPVAPTLTSATIGADGETWALVFSEAVEIGAGGNAGFAVTMTTAGVIGLTYTSGSGSNTLVYTGDTTINGDDTVTSGLDYTQPGDGIESTTGIDLATFADASVTNSSAVGPPGLISATIGADGTTWSMVFSKIVNIGAGGNAGFAVTMSTAGAITLTYASGAGTDTLIYTGSTLVEQTETATSGLDYTQPGDGIEGADGQDLASIIGATVTNSSEQGTASIVLKSFEAPAWGVISTPSMSWEAGDVVVVFAGCWEGDGVLTVSDSAENQYTEIADSKSYQSGSATIEWFYHIMDSPGSGTIALGSHEDASNWTIRAYVFSGVDNTNPVDVAVANINSNASPLFSTIHNDEAVLIAAHHDGGVASTRTITPDTMIWDYNGLLLSHERVCAHEIYDHTLTDTQITITPNIGACQGISVISLVAA